MKFSIEKKLRDTFSPTYLIVKDESHLHVGHTNYKPEGNTHFSVTCISPLFSGLSRIERHQKVYACLEEELKGGLHALRLKLLSPDEDGVVRNYSEGS